MIYGYDLEWNLKNIINVDILFVLQSKFERDFIIVMLAFAICIPNFFSFFESLMKSVFGNKAWPTFASIFVVSTLKLFICLSAIYVFLYCMAYFSSPKYLCTQ